MRVIDTRTSVPVEDRLVEQAPAESVGNDGATERAIAENDARRATGNTLVVPPTSFQAENARRDRAWAAEAEALRQDANEARLYAANLEARADELDPPDEAVIQARRPIAKIELFRHNGPFDLVTVARVIIPTDEPYVLDRAAGLVGIRFTPQG